MLKSEGFRCADRRIFSADQAGSQQQTKSATVNAIAQKIIEDIETLPPDLQEETFNFVQFLKSKVIKSDCKLKRAEPNGIALAQLMKEASEKNLFFHIENPAEWQREIRKERSLPGRES
ncbi:hypothetical protein [Candidatus Electronema sp. JC]|uniref:hypothetical protein n=1 Tax=Candidatus Electronema sp. JC TaxID=3401570 RepID=UPI003B42E6E5